MYVPNGQEGLQDLMNTYKMLGFNGEIGSIDGTHVKWSKCPVRRKKL